MSEDERIDGDAVDTAAEVAPEGMPDQETMRRFEEEIRNLTVADHVMLMLHSLSSLAIERMGLTPDTEARKDLAQASMAIDAFRALVGVLEGKRSPDEMAAHRAALSQLQMAYVAALGGGGRD